MSAHPLASFAQMRQRPDAGPVLPPRKPGRHRREGVRFRFLHRTRAPDVSTPAVLTPADLRA
jgi:hypothetical protein